MATVDIASITSFRDRMNARAATHSELKFMVVGGSWSSLMIDALTLQLCIDISDSRT